jgi:hypothetical protein
MELIQDALNFSTLILRRSSGYCSEVYSLYAAFEKVDLSFSGVGFQTFQKRNTLHTCFVKIIRVVLLQKNHDRAHTVDVLRDETKRCEREQVPIAVQRPRLEPHPKRRAMSFDGILDRAV